MPLGKEKKIIPLVRDQKSLVRILPGCISIKINVAELGAVAKGINMAVKWGGKRITIKSDSATVFGWVKVMLSQEQRVKTIGARRVVGKKEV